MTHAPFSTIQLLNKSYKIKCPEDEQANLQLSAKKLNEHLCENKRKFKQLDDFQLLLLAALHISHELLACQTQQLQQREQLAHVINALEQQMNPGIDA